MLTHHWLINHVWIFIIAIEIAINTHPGHFVVAVNFMLSYYRNIVFRNTSYLAGATSCA